MTPHRRISAFIALFVALFAPGIRASDPPYPQWPRAITAPLIAQARRGLPPASEFGLFFNVYTENPIWDDFDTGQVPFRMDTILIAALALPMYPRQGPHMIENYPGGSNSFYATFIPQLQQLLTIRIPQTDYSGLIILDYEFFCPWWTGHYGWPSTEGPLAFDYDFRDDWRDCLRVTRAATLLGMTPEQQEAYFKQEWMATTREFFERVVAAARAVRPQAKISIYNQPTQTYWAWLSPSAALDQRRGHDEVPWFWDLIDIIVPSIYPAYQSVPRTQVRGPGQDYEDNFDLYVRNNIEEAIRVSRGKPVYPFISFVYHQSNAWYGNQPCNNYNMRRGLEISRELGCDGAAIFGWFRTQQEYDTQAPFFSRTFVPFLEQFAQLPAVPPAVNQCAPDLGSQGGVAGADGALDDNDFVAFVDYFFTYNFRADLGRQGGIKGSDGILDSNDFVTFINLYMSGCNTR